jgi:hypothetical protein
MIVILVAFVFVDFPRRSGSETIDLSKRRVSGRGVGKCAT